jgi:hypothetical protein
MGRELLRFLPSLRGRGGVKCQHSYRLVGLNRGKITNKFSYGMAAFQVVKQVFDRNPRVEKNRRSALDFRVYGYQLIHETTTKMFIKKVTKMIYQSNLARRDLEIPTHIISDL